MHNTVAAIHLKFKLSLSSGETPPFAAYIGCTNKSKLIFFRSPVLWEETELLQTSPAWQRQSVLLSEIGTPGQGWQEAWGYSLRGLFWGLSILLHKKRQPQRQHQQSQKIHFNKLHQLQRLFQSPGLKSAVCLKTGLLCRAQTTVSYVLLLVDTNVPAAGQAQMLGLNKL